MRSNVRMRARVGPKARRLRPRVAFAPKRLIRALGVPTGGSVVSVPRSLAETRQFTVVALSQIGTGGAGFLNTVGGIPLGATLAGTQTWINHIDGKYKEYRLVAMDMHFSPYARYAGLPSVQPIVGPVGTKGPASCALVPDDTLPGSYSAVQLLEQPQSKLLNFSDPWEIEYTFPRDTFRADDFWLQVSNVSAHPGFWYALNSAPWTTSNADVGDLVMRFRVEVRTQVN